MTLSLKHFIPAGLVLLALVLGSTYALAEVSFNETTPEHEYQTFTFFTATTTNATSTNMTGGGGYFKIAGAKRVVFYFSHGGVSTTSTSGGTFEVEVSPDGSTWYDYAALKRLDSTLSATTTITIQGATSTLSAALTLDNFTFYGARCVVSEIGTEGQQGEHTCKATADY